MGSAIPTLGAPTTVLDQYRTVGIYRNNLGVLNTAVTDLFSVCSIAKVAEGGISHHHEIEAAEVALQSLLLHERVRVVVPGPKIEHDNGLVTYLRFDDDIRTPLGFRLLEQANGRDWLIAPEYVRIHDGGVHETSLSDSPIRGLTRRQLYNKQERPIYWNDAISDAVRAALHDHNLPLYLSDARLTNGGPDCDFTRRFYQRMRISWDKAVADVPPIVYPFRLPPLLAIVLDRLTNREDLVEVVMELRDELAEARRELHHFNYMAWLEADEQASLERKAADVQASFDAIIPESRLSDAQRFARNFNRVSGIYCGLG